MIHKVGAKRQSSYAGAHKDAIDRFGQIIEEENINCDFKRVPAVFFTTDDCNVKDLKKEANTAKKLGNDAYYMENMTDVSLKAVNVKNDVPATVHAFPMKENCLIILHR